MSVIDLTKDKEKGEFVEIPELDMYDFPHPKVQINRMEFLPGNKYKLPENVATEVKRILHSLEQSQIRLLRPRKDRRSIGQVQGNNPTSGILMDQD